MVELAFVFTVLFLIIMASLWSSSLVKTVVLVKVLPVTLLREDKMVTMFGRLKYFTNCLPGSRLVLGTSSRVLVQWNFGTLAPFLLCLLSFIVLCAPAPGQAASPFHGKRVMLDGDIPNWTKQEYVDQALTRIQEAGFNVYIPTVWQGRGTSWPSRHAPWDSELADRSKDHFDPLQYLITKAHAMGIEVHPWFTLTLRQADIFPEFVLPDAREPAFNVHDPGFRALIVNLIEEVVSKYDVDGVNLDYVRAVDLCLTKPCREEYSAKYGRNLTVDAALFKVSPSLVPTLVNYQESAVTEIVASISQRVRQVRPGTVISVDGLIGHPPLSQGQNVVAWANNGLIDVVFRMDYSRNLNIPSLDATRQELANPTVQSLMISNMTMDDELGRGVKHSAREGKWLADRITQVQDRWPGTGVAVYFYKYLTDEQIDALKQGPFRKPMMPPMRPRNLSAF